MSKKNILTVTCLISGIVLVALGVTNGDAIFVMEKAIRICLECIGIG